MIASVPIMIQVARNQRHTTELEIAHVIFELEIAHVIFIHFAITIVVVV